MNSHKKCALLLLYFYTLLWPIHTVVSKNIVRFLQSHVRRHGKPKRNSHHAKLVFSELSPKCISKVEFGFPRKLEKPLISDNSLGMLKTTQKSFWEKQFSWAGKYSRNPTQQILTCIDKTYLANFFLGASHLLVLGENVFCSCFLGIWIVLDKWSFNGYFRKCGKHVKNAILEILRQSLKKYYESH